MKITLHEFCKLPEQEQYQVIFNEGILLDYKHSENQRFALYAVDRFFVEVEYTNDRNESIKHIPFTKGKILDKYVNLNLD